MKTKAILLCMVLALTMSMAAMFGCSEGQSQDASSDPVKEAVTTPTIVPDDHEGRFQMGGADNCYSCHGNGDKGNPNDSAAVVIPENHYVGDNYESKEIVAERLECYTCHAGSW